MIFNPNKKWKFILLTQLCEYQVYFKFNHHHNLMYYCDQFVTNYQKKKKLETLIKETFFVYLTRHILIVAYNSKLKFSST